jgi:hypothetical protein
MSVLWGIFGLGPAEMLVLGMLCVGLPSAVALVVLIVLLVTRPKGDGKND